MDELLGPLEEVVADFKKKYLQLNSEQSFIDSVLAFVHAVNWKEPWIVGLISLQVILLLSVIVFRRRQTFQGLVFAAAAGVVYASEKINTHAAEHWQRFAEQPYFDKQGVFFSAVVSAPLLLCMLIILINLLVEAGRLLIKVKTEELKHRARELAKADAADTKKSK